MEFTLDFLEIFFQFVGLISPLLGFFSVLVVVLGFMVGRHEGWSRFDAFYWTFITAFTVGYGDIRPTKKLSKLLALAIALLGFMFTGVIVAVTVTAATESFEKNVEVKIELGVSSDKSAAH